jgi:Domain of unknown function (DUF4124)
MFTAGDSMKKRLLVFLLAATVAQAETYKWTDNDGTVHFSDSLGKVPADYLKSAKPLGMDTKGATNTYKAVSPAEPRQSADGFGSVASRMEELKERMLNDEGTMALIAALQNDPDMQAILGDPSVARAIQTGDIGALVSNPDFQKLLNNPRVREIENRMQQSGTR